MTTIERIKHAKQLLEDKTDLEPATRELFDERIRSAIVLYDEREAMTQTLVELYRKNETPPDDEVQLMIEAGWKLQTIERSLNFVIDMLET